VKKKYYTFILLLPTILINYVTLTILDIDHNLSLTSTLIVSLFNLTNILFIILLNKTNLKKVVIIFLGTIILFTTLDFSYQKYVKKNSYQIQDKKLGWILNKSIKKKFTAKSKKNRNYEIDYNSSEKFGFRHYDNKKNFDKTILILGDSFTVGPYASNDQMYFSEIKRIFEKNNLNYNWYVMGSAGWGTLQQYIYLKNNIDHIKPDILVHQFCHNDFYNNSIKIEENTYLRSQYIFRPFWVDKKIIYKNNLFHKLYKFLYTNSFVFKTIDNLITNKQYQKNKSYFKKNYSKEEYNEAINITDLLIKKIKYLVGDKKLYFIVDCYNKENVINKSFQKIFSENELFGLTKPLIELKKAEEKGEDIFFFDGSHLNDIGNKIYGSEIGKEIIKIIK
jgi:hypothetical protein